MQTPGNTLKSLACAGFAGVLFTALPQIAQAGDEPVDLSKGKNLYVVGYSHLDTEWRWSYPQVIREFLVNTMRDNLALIGKYPDYIFNFTGSRRYEMMKEYYPEDYRAVKAAVAAGKWFPAGSSVDEGDSVVPSAESLIRHVLYGNRFFQREFGKSSDEFMLPDCFGFPWALPTILAHCGIKGFSTQKLTWGSAVGIPFKVGRWVGPDGSEVIAALDPGAYTGKVKDNLALSDSWEKRIAENGRKSGVFVDYHYYGTGDRGGAPGEDSVQWIEKSVNTEGPVRVISAPADAMFRALTPEQIQGLPAYNGEFLLTEHSAGVLTSQAYIKRMNRKNELLADAAERAAVGAMWLGAQAYPSTVFYDAWNLILGSQMHDILPGTSLPKAYEFAWNDEFIAANLLAETEISAVGGIAAAMDTTARGVPVVVYNPLSVAREDAVEAEIPFPAGSPAAVRVFGPDGEETPSQVLAREDRSLRVLFLARVPSVGLASFDVRPSASAYEGAGALRIAGREIENARYLVKLDENGDVASIFDKAVRREMLSAPLRIEFHAEKPRNYPAWNMDWSDRQRAPVATVGGPARIRIVEKGPVRVAFEVERETMGSKFVQQVRLGAGDAGNRVELPLDVDWQTRGVSLKQAFPLAVANPVASYDSQAGIVRRGNNDKKKYEVPQHEWFDLTDPAGAYGVTVLNESKYGSDKPDDRTMRLTLLYTPGVRGSYQDQETQDIGRHRIGYAVAGHAGPVADSDTIWQAARYNQPLVPFLSPAHSGPLGRAFSLFQVSTPQAAISAIKKAEDSDDIVVRLRELAGKPAHGRLTAAAPILKAVQIDGQERNPAPAKTEAGGVSFDLPAFGLRAFGLQLAKAPQPVAPAVSKPLELPFNSDAISSDANRADGAFDGDGRTYPAEMVPAELSRGGVTFRMGPVADGAKNAVACAGQTIALPQDAGDRLYLLASANENVAAEFRVGEEKQTLQIGDWSGYVGQWDNRLWAGEVPELTYEWHNPLDGLVPGFTRRAPIAWFASHLHHPREGNEFYRYSYLFQYALAIPKGAASVTLPDDPRVRVFAMSVAKSGPAPLTLAAPLYDTLESHIGGDQAPRIVAPGGVASDVTEVTIEPPLYWKGALRYTLDGSEPGENSPAADGPIRIASTTTVKARAFLPSGPGPVAEKKVEVDDTTPPRVLEAAGFASRPAIWLSFSEEVDKASAESPANYAVPGAKVVRAAAIGREVTLALDRPATGPVAEIVVNGVKDRSPAGNARAAQRVKATLLEPVLTQQQGDKPLRVTNQGLPVKAGAPWTLNLFVRVDDQPENRTLIAGFGSLEDKAGQGRYFSKFANGIHFWISDTDVDTTEPLDTGRWQMLTATYDGKTMRLYKNARLIATQAVELRDDEAVAELLPIDLWDKERRLKGQVADMTVWDAALSRSAVELLWEKRDVGR